jgi:DNA topoisomerase-1
MTRLRKAHPDKTPGYRRVRQGSAFSFVSASDRVVSAAEHKRVESLAIPPAWNDVWISDAPNTHILAIGVDEAGRRQYIYHPRWRKQQDIDKFARALRLAEVLPAARREVTKDLRRASIDRTAVLAGAFRLLDLSAIRVGSEEYASTYGSRGLTTLQRRHVTVADTTITLAFPAKGGQRAEMTVRDAELATLLIAMGCGLGRQRVFTWREKNALRRMKSTHLNEYIRLRTHESFTAKDFRTLKGTAIAARSLATQGTSDDPTVRAERMRRAVADVAAILGNTAAVARASYIDPRLLTHFEAGRVASLRGSPERAVIDLLKSG